MNHRLVLLCALFIASFSQAQVTVKGNFGFELSEDSAQAEALEASLNAFLTQAQNRAFTHEYVDTNHKKEFAFFFDGLNGIGKSDNKTFHDPLVMKSYSEFGKEFFITVAFTGTKEGAPFIYKIVELKAVPYEDHYRFYSPFKERTADYKTQTIGNVTYHYQRDLDVEKAQSFAEFKKHLASLTHTPDPALDYYKFRSLDEMLKAYGFLADANKCNFLCHDLGFCDSEGKMFVTGTDKEDFIFEYIGNHIYYNRPNAEDLYWPFLLGVSAYYGGYSLSGDDIEELKAQFRAELEKNPGMNFLEEFKKGRKSSINRHFCHYVMSAFLCEKLLDEKSFDEVLALMYTGRKGEEFFSTLKEVAGIDESNFHETILRLIG